MRRDFAWRTALTAVMSGVVIACSGGQLAPRPTVSAIGQPASPTTDLDAPGLATSTTGGIGGQPGGRETRPTAGPDASAAVPGAAQGVATTETLVASGQAVGVPAGDYLLTADVRAVSSVRVSGAVVQYETGTGPWERVEAFHASLTGTAIRAEVRVTSPMDTFVVMASGPLRVSKLDLTSANWSYLVRGTEVTDHSDAIVVWHGVNDNPGLPIPAGIQALKADTRANIVRVPVFEYQWLPFFQAAFVPVYRQHIIETVNAINAAGMVAIIDLHAAGHDDPSFNPGYSDVGQLDADQHSVAFWQDAASLWANKPGVIFELFNEPRMNATDKEPDGQTGSQVWRNGGSLAYRSYGWTAPGMQLMADTIRAAGASNLILIDGLDWAGDLRPIETDPVDGTNLAYAFHSYTKPSENSTAVPSHLLSNVAPVMDPSGEFRFATLATEFGTLQQDNQLPGSEPGSSYLARVIAWIGNHGAGWLAWGWYPNTYDGYGLLSSYPLALTSRGQTVVRLM